MIETDRPAYSIVDMNAADWDNWVMANSDSTPFHLSAWGEAVQAATGHRYRCIGICNASGVPIAGLPYHDVRSRLFGNALVSTGFAVGGGIIGDEQAAIDALAAEFWRRAANSNASAAELRGGTLPSSGWHEKADTYAGFTTPLAEHDEAQLVAIPRKQRAEIRKALAALGDGALTVETGNDERMAQDHYMVYAQSVHNLGTPVFPKALFDEIRKRFGADVDILTVKADGVPIASVLSLYFKGRVMPYWGGGSQAARAARANELLYYKLMCHARARGCTMFDFGRSKSGTGAFAYKKNWGIAPQPLSYAVRTADGKEPRDINPLNPKYQMKIKLWQKLPLWVANRIGPLIARELA